ncbi:MAG TPA: enoyl-CoA hydratase/isomerase family protein [Pseudolabrys sp.]|nr:enoyl-CoA hydratase/isomerase family protein [Pseudolabrys sp.]
MSTAQYIDVSVADTIATVALNRPDVRNAINDALRTELMATLERLANDSDVRAIVLTGKGAAFCAGGDIAGMQQRLNEPPGQIAFNGWKRQKRTHQGMSFLHGISKPTIAAVNGAAVGLGCDLALACDFIIASERAVFAMSFIHRGLIPDGGGMYYLPRRVGLARAKELIFTGRRIEPEEALHIGMIDRVTKADTLLAEAQQWAASLSQGSPTALALSKGILDESFELSCEQVLALSREAQAICYTTTEHRQSVAAFLDKSKK